MEENLIVSLCLIGITLQVIRTYPSLIGLQRIQKKRESDETFDFKSYQEEIVSTRIVKKDSKIEYLCYAALGLTEEAGEFAGRLKKIVRDKGGVLDTTDKLLLKKELGDQLWYIADAAHDLDFTLEEIAIENRNKCRDRAKRGTIQGEGDNR